MANLIRSAKSGSSWTRHDLESYHINLYEMDPLAFFGLQELPQPPVHEELLNIADAGLMQQDSHAELITLLDFAMIPNKGESAVDDFAVDLFKVLGYVHRERVARTRVDIPLYICGEVRHAKTNVCIVDHTQNDMFLLVQENKKLLTKESSSDVKAQLVAEAIAAFNVNNQHRVANALPPLVQKVMPGIIMVGTAPMFFKIPVTEALSTHIFEGTYPPEETHVTFCHPPGIHPDLWHVEGMRPLDNRHEVLRCYEAFKTIVEI